jgi:hypothetical protein
MDIIGALTLTPIQAPAVVNATGQSAPVDAVALCKHGALVLQAFNTAGTTPTLALKLQHAPDVNVIGTIAYTGTGNGRITDVVGGPGAVAEDITITFSNATAAAVAGSVSGSLGTATVGTRFNSARISFTLTAGSTAFVNTDEFTVPVAARVFTDVPGGAFAGLTTGASSQKLGLNFDQLGRYLRMHYTIAGTNTPAYVLGVAAISDVE